MDFRDSVEQAARASICSVLAGAEAAAWAGDALIPSWVSNPVPDVVRKARLAACSNPDPIVELPESTFSGGQCPGVLYELDATVFLDKFGGITINLTSDPLAGPIATSRLFVNGSGFVAWELLNEAGASAEVRQVGSSQAWDRNDDFELFTVQQNTLVRSDGQPDTCGDPPGPPVPPYSPVTINQDFSYTDNSQTTVNEEGDFTVWAPVVIGGNLIAPVTVDIGGLTINGELDIETGDFNFNFGIPGGGPGYEDIPVENPDTSPEEPEENPEVFYGLQVFSFQSGTDPVITSDWGQESAPTLHLPRTANVWFIVPVGQGWGWIGPILCQHLNQVVMVPGGLPAIDHRVVPNTGWDVEVNRLSKPDCGCRSAST